MTPSTHESQCSFCRKQLAEVRQLIAGPGVSICNECVALSAQIIAEGHGAAKPPEGSTCQMHQQAAVSVCRRCGTFLCAACGGAARLCAPCEAREPPVRTTPRYVPSWVSAILLGGLTLLFVYLLFGVSR